MKPGNYVEIRTAVGDVAEALAFYQRLGFRALGDDVVSDGCINIHLLSGDEPSPTLSYAGSDLAALAALGLGAEISGDVATLTTPDGLHIRFTSQASAVPMPTGTPTSRTPISRLGMFGEFSLPVADRDAAIAFWQKLGFEQFLVSDEPYPWGIFIDGLIVLGLHQTRDFGLPNITAQPYITYFTSDMAERIAQLEADGSIVVRFVTEGDKDNAAFTAPGGQHFFLFSGEIPALEGGSGDGGVG